MTCYDTPRQYEAVRDSCEMVTCLIYRGLKKVGENSQLL